MEMIGALGWIPFLTAGIGSIVGGWASGALIRRGRAAVASRLVVMALSAAGMLAGIPAVLSGNAALSMGLIAVVTFAYCAWASNILALPTDLFPKAIVATLAGVAGTGAALGGMIFTLATGAAVDHISYTPVFVAAGVMPVLAVCIAAFGLRATRSAGPPEDRRAQHA
jgi:ACS family hexuronate transporter-like MFS transporter